MRFRIRHTVEHIIEGDPSKMTDTELTAKVAESRTDNMENCQLFVNGDASSFPVSASLRVRHERRAEAVHKRQFLFCQEVIAKLRSDDLWRINSHFLHRVDPVAQNLSNYFHVVKEPMDLSTIQYKLDMGEYKTAEAFKKDVKLVFKNFYKFNPADDSVNECGRQLEELFDKKWATRRDWMPAWGYHLHSGCDKSDDQQDAEIPAIELFQKPCSPFELKVNFTGAEHSLMVTWADCIGDAKKKLSLNFGVATRIQRLIVNSQEVHDNQKLRHVMVGGPSPVELRLNLNKTLKFLLRTLAGKTIELQCADSSTIYDVKSMVEDKAGILVNQQRLLFKRGDLDDDVKLSVCGLHDGDVVHLVLKLKAQDRQL